MDAAIWQRCDLERTEDPAPLQPKANILFHTGDLLTDLSHMPHSTAEANWSSAVAQVLSTTGKHDYLLNLNPEG